MLDYENLDKNYNETFRTLLIIFTKVLGLKNITSYDWNIETNETIRNGLIQDFYSRFAVISRLIKATDKNENKIQETISSIHTLNRSLLEILLTYKYIFTESENSIELENLRCKLYIRDGLQTRQGFPTWQPEIQSKKELEKNEIKLMEDQIENHLQNLGISEKKENLFKRWKPNYSDLVNNSNFGEYWKATIYKYLSGHSHSLFSGLIQSIENNRQNNGDFLIINVAVYSHVISSVFINDLITKQNKIMINLEENEEELLLFFLKLAQR